MECVLYNYVANNYTVPTDKETVRKRADAIDSTSTHGAVGAKEQYHLSLLNVLAILIGHMKFTSHETRLETLRWLLWLHKKLPRRVGIVMVIMIFVLQHLLFQIYRQAGKLLPQLQEMLTDISDRVYIFIKKNGHALKFTTFSGIEPCTPSHSYFINV